MCDTKMSTVVTSTASLEREFQSQMVRGKKEPSLSCIVVVMRLSCWQWVQHWGGGAELVWSWWWGTGLVHYRFCTSHLGMRSSCTVPETAILVSQACNVQSLSMLWTWKLRALQFGIHYNHYFCHRFWFLLNILCVTVFIHNCYQQSFMKTWSSVKVIIS